MMRLRRSAAGPVVLAGALTAALLAPSAATASSGTTRYASPGGVTSATCPKSAPCGLSTAVNGATGHDTVIVEPGTYGRPTAGNGMLSIGGSTKVEGEAGHPFPVIYDSAQVAVNETGGSLSRVTIYASGQRAGVLASAGSVDHVIVIASHAKAAACDIEQAISDSLCVATGASGTAVSLGYQPPASGAPANHLHPSVYGVTAEATAAGGTGLLLAVAAKNTVTVRVTNSILHGGKYDAEAETSATTATAKIVLRHSDLRTTHHVSSDGAPSLSVDGTDIHSRPVFVSPKKDDFAEKASSPTINKGTAAADGDTDLAGHPRWLGSAPDMGAYEFRQPPVIAGLIVTHDTAHTAQFSVKVNPEGLTTKVHVVALLGSHELTSNTVTGGHGRGYTTVTHLHIAGLHARSVYHIYAVATNTGGKGRTENKPLHTGA